MHCCYALCTHRAPEQIEKDIWGETRKAHASARRTAAVASPNVLPHARRAERPIKKKPQGKRNLPANEAVAKRLIIENLERATPEEIIQLAFCVCLSE